MTPTHGPPSGWKTVPLAELAASEPNSITDGPFGSKLKTEHYTASGPRVLRLQNIGDGVFCDERAHISEAHFGTLQKHRVFEGDLIIAALGETLPRACIVPATLGPAIVKADCIRFKPNPRLVSSKFLLYALIAPQVRHAAATIIHGVGRPRLNQSEIKSLPVPLAPREVQDRIVAEIEKQFTRLDAAVAALERLQAHLRRYRAAVLKAAVEGRLGTTEDAAAAVSKGDVRSLPTSWRWTDFGALLTRIESGKNFRCEERPPNDGEFGVVKVSAVTWGVFDSDETKTCTDPDRFDPRLVIHPGDFLFSRANTIQLVGSCVIARSVTRRVMLSDKILRFTLVDGVDPRWALWVLRSPWGRHEIERLATGNQESMRNIGQDRIRQIRVPLPPLSVQVATVTRIEAMLSRVDVLERAAAGGLARAQRLRASILRAAFEGRLVAPEQSARAPAA